MCRQVSIHAIFRMERTVQHVSGDSVVRAFMCSFSLSLCMRARKVFVSVFFILSFYPKLMFCLRIFSQKNSFRWCSFTAYIYEGIERGCALYCEGYVNPRGYEQKQFVRYGSGFVPIRYDVNPGSVSYTHLTLPTKA